MKCILSRSANKLISINTLCDTCLILKITCSCTVGWPGFAKIAKSLRLQNLVIYTLYCFARTVTVSEWAISRVQFFVTPWTAAARLLCPWGFPSKNTGVGCHFLLQGIFLTQGSNPHRLHLLRCRQILYHWTTGEVGAIITKYHKLGELNNNDFFSDNSRG